MILIMMQIESSISNFNNFELHQIYPNPFNDRTIIEFPNPLKEKYTLRVVDLSGKTVRIIQNITDSRVELEKGDLPSGIYFIELRGADNFSRKVMIE